MILLHFEDIRSVGPKAGARVLEYDSVYVGIKSACYISLSWQILKDDLVSSL